jgi:hypothetical protein
MAIYDVNGDSRVYVGKAPGIDELKDAAAIVVESDGDRSASEHHPPPMPLPIMASILPKRRRF